MSIILNDYLITNSWRVRKGVSVISFFLAIWRTCILLFSWFYFLVVQMSYCIMCMTHHTKYYTACYQLTTKRTKESLYCALCVVFRQSLLLLPSDNGICIVIFNIPAWMLKATTRFFKINEWPTLLWKHTKTFTVDLSSGDFRCVRYAYTHKYILIHV